MALAKWYIEIKASSNVRDPLGQGWSDDGNVVELQHFSGMHCSGRELWSHPLQGATPSNCEGLRMPAHDDGATPIGAGVRKPPREETVGDVAKLRVGRYGDFGAGGSVADVR